MWRWRQNDAENSALPSQRKNMYVIKIEIIFHNIIVFDQYMQPG